MYLVFVYGSLMKGGEGHDRIKDAIFIGDVTTKPKYRKVLLGKDYVGLDQGDEGVRGELYAVGIDKLKELDDYENDIYERGIVELTIGRTAFAYFLKNNQSKDETQVQ